MKNMTLHEFETDEFMLFDRDQMRNVKGGSISCQRSEPKHFLWYRVNFWSCSNGDKFVTLSWLDDGKWKVQADIQIA